MKYSALLLTLLLFLLACQKHHDNPGNSTPKPPPDLDKPYTLPSAPQANPAYDASNYGIYKGIAIFSIDSTKTFSLNIANNGRSVYGLEYEKGLLRDSLIRYVVDSATYQFHQPYEIDSSVITPGNYLFAGFYSYIPDSGDAVVQLTAHGDGSSPGIAVHYWNPYLTACLKETSKNQVSCYVGSWQGASPFPGNPNDSGRIAFVLNADTAVALQIDPYESMYSTTGGAAVTNGHFVLTIFQDPPPSYTGDNYVFTGSVSGNTVSGTWKRSESGASGAFTAQRTL